MTWHTAQGNADLRATFGANRHDLNVSTQQMCILLLFNSADTLSYSDIQDATQVRVLPAAVPSLSGCSAKPAGARDLVKYITQ